MAFGEIFMRNTASSPEWARWLHLARSGSQSHRAIWFILPARGASHIINRGYYTVARRYECENNISRVSAANE